MVPLRHNDRKLSVALMVSLSNHEGVAQNKPPTPVSSPRRRGTRAQNTGRRNPTLESRLRGNVTE